MLEENEENTFEKLCQKQAFFKGSFAYGCSMKKAATLEEQAECQGTNLQCVPALSIAARGSCSTQRLSCGGGRDTRAAGILCADRPCLYLFIFQ